MEWFLYDNGLRHETVKNIEKSRFLAGFFEVTDDQHIKFYILQKCR